ncbi:MAG: Clp protease ClpP [Bacteroidales bacterium]|jgi:ATP-dependent protease ClpP protease subunit
MGTLQLDIDGFIGAWGYSKSYIKNFLAAAGKGPVSVRVSSLGGDVDHALAIHDQFREHGQVTIQLTGFNASAATLITLGAQKVIINSNSFYLIHKALAWVNEWGNMNPDDIDTVIAELEKQKLFLEKVTLQLAKMYSGKSGKPVAEILGLMKEETWLNAEEAFSWGFVDEINEPSLRENLLKNEKMITMLNCAELPIPCSIESFEDPVPGIIEKVTTTLKKTINSLFHMKQYTALNTLLAVPSLESTEEGIYLNETQAAVINTALEANQQIVTERDNAIGARDQAVTDRSSALAALDAIDPSIATATTIEAKIEAIRLHMASKPAVAPSGVQTKQDPVPSSDGVDWATLNALPHMQEDKY